jgi:hypothetical protein
MQNKLLALVLCGLPLIAAEKNREWQAGQVVESKALADPRDHAIAAADKTYLVRGSAGGEEALAVGAAVRFAVEDKNLFVSIAGKEYKLYVLGVRTSSAKPAPTGAPVASVAPTTPPPTPIAPPPPAAPVAPPAPKAPAAPAPKAADTPRPAETAGAPAAKPSAPAGETLDNDAVVKMILGGLKEDTVIRVIEARPGKYTLTSDAVQGLKAAGVPQSVITAMSAKMTAQH